MQLLNYRAMHLAQRYLQCQIEDNASHWLAYKLLSDPRLINSECVPISTTDPLSTTTIRSANLPAAHRLEVKRVAAPVLRRDLIIFASSTSFICDVASSRRRIEPTRHFRTVRVVGWLSFPEISCANILVNRTRDQSDGDKGYADGSVDDGFSSSSFATTTVDSFDGRRVRTFAPSPVI